MCECAPRGRFNDVENWVGVGEFCAYECFVEICADFGWDVLMFVKHVTNVVDSVVGA